MRWNVEKRRDMRIIHGLELCIVPVRISSRATRPLANAPFDLNQKEIILCVEQVSRVSVSASDRTTVSVIAIIGTGIGEKCS